MPTLHNMPEFVTRFLKSAYGLEPGDLLRLDMSRHSDGLTEITLTLLVADSDLAKAREIVSVPVLKYGERCERHNMPTYVLDGVTFHRETLGACTDTSASPKAWSGPIRADPGATVITHAAYTCGTCLQTMIDLDSFRTHMRVTHFKTV